MRHEWFPVLFLRTAAVSVLGVLLAIDARAQVRFAEPRGSHLAGVQHAPQDPRFIVGDFDGDGDLDLLFGGQLLRNDGQGVFGTPESVLGVGLGAVGDIDGDGDLDVLVASGGITYGSGDVRILRNDGSGHFTATVLISTVTAAGVALRDVDGDGDLDAVLFFSSSLGAPIVQLWTNAGAGTFLDATGQIAGQLANVSCSGGVVFDVDGDGDLDLFAATAPPQLFYNDASGFFTPAPALPGFGAPRCVADLDGDGDPDVIDGTAWQNVGGGSYVPIQPPLPVDVAGAPELSAADVDGDGFVDLIGVSFEGQPVVARGLGALQFVDVTATWIDARDRVLETYGFVFGAHAAADFDGDGDVDLAVAGLENRDGGSNTVGIPPRLYLDTGARFSQAGAMAFAPASRNVIAAALGDVDGDGDLDLFTSEGPMSGTRRSTGWQQRLWRQDGEGRFEALAPIPAPPSPFDFPAAAAFVDIDGDGDLDLAFAQGGAVRSLAPFTVVPQRLWRNDGAGVFTDVTAAQFGGVATTGSSLAVGDVDGDGDPDIVVGAAGTGFPGTGAQNRLLRNDGAGTFVDATAQLPARLDATTAVLLGDVDGDGDLDLVVQNGWPLSATAPGEALRLWQNDGTGHYSDVTAARLPALTSADWLGAADRDGDGDLDLTLRSLDLVNDGTGTFTAAPAAFDRLLARDFDGDGVADDLSAAAVQAVAGVMANVVDYAVTGDLDGDRDLDVVWVASANSNLINQPQLGLLKNLRADLQIGALPRVGRDFVVALRSVHGTAASAAWVGIAAAPLVPRVQLFDFGLLAIDPGSLDLFGPVLVPDADTNGELRLPIPVAPALVDQTAHCQALVAPVGGAMRLTNAVAFTVRG